jgi:DNA-directed RNA polymerase II subunit RPB9
MGEDGEEEEQIEDSEGLDILPEMCTLCGQEILCPVCGGPTDAGVMLEAEDPESEVKKKGDDVVEAEKRERTLSSAGS